MADNLQVMELNRTVRTTAKLALRKTPSSSAAKVADIPKGTEVKATKIKGNQWYYVTYLTHKGWILKTATIAIPSDDSSTGTASVTTADISTTDSTSSSTITELDQETREQIYNEYTNYFDGYDSNKGNNVLATNMNGIIGMPYQFSREVDLKPEEEGNDFFGMKYMERIVTRSPLLLISPGKVDFMPNSAKEVAAGVIMELGAKKFTNDDQNDLSEILTGGGKYYSFQFDYVNYYKFVNRMARACSIFMGIDECIVSMGDYKKKLGDFKWENALGNDFSSYLDAKETIAFYIDSVNQVTDTFSNTTTESQLASKINSYSDVGKEISFLLGSKAGVEFDLFSQDEIDNITKSIEDFSDKYLNGNQLFKDLGHDFTTVAAGGKLIFPEIWEDSTFTRSFDISMKLRTPDCDPLSWYLNICIPLCFIIGLVAPQQNTKNGYFTPHLVRAFYKGLFNVDMGLVTDLSLSKGSEGGWTIDGLPTVVDVNMTIKDLYQPVVSITGNDKWFMSNTSLMDYMANMCGININKPDLMRTFEIYAMLKKSKITDLPNNAWMGLTQKASNFMMNAYNNIGTWLP